MKNSKVLTIVLALIAVAAIVFGVVTLGQKGELQKKADELNAQIEALKSDAEKAADEAARAAEEEAAKAAEEAAKAGKPVEITILFEGSNVTDDAAVLEKLNAYLTDKIGVTLKPTWGTWGNFDTLAMSAINSGSSEYDILFTSSWNDDQYGPYAKKDAFLRLDDPKDDLIAQYGAEMKAALPEILLEGAVTEGPDGEKGIYAVPGFKDIATMNAWDVNVTLLEKYGYTLEDVEKAGFYGWGDIFAKVKAGEEAEKGGVFYPFVFEGAVVERFVTGTPIVTGDSGLLLSYYMNADDVSKPGAYGNVFFNKYATPEFEKFARQMREYFLAGYIDPAIAIGETATDTWRNAQNTANYLISSEVTIYGNEITTSKDRGIQVAYLLATEAPYTDTTSIQGAMYAISANSAHPVEAMKFLNLLSSDPVVVTLLDFGVEGVHYNLNDSGEVVFTEARSAYTPWKMGMGNVTLLPPEEGQGTDYQERFAAFYGSSKMLPLYGFSFDTKPVELEIASIANVKEAYALSLCTGAVDVDTALPELLSKMDAEGIRKVVDEANAQLKTFLGE